MNDHRMISPVTILFASFCFLATLAPSRCGSKAGTNGVNKSIFKISYSTTGGRSGNYKSMDVSPDSLVYLEAVRGIEKIIREKTEAAFWTNLTRAINLSDLEKIKSSPGHSLYDGIDITLSVETPEKKYLIVNGNEDTANYEKIGGLITLLENKWEELGKKIFR